MNNSDLSALAADIQKRVDQIACPVHHKHAAISHAEGLPLQVSMCCRELYDLVEPVLHDVRYNPVVHEA